jgi:opacity protein-like surface antigen
MKRLLGLLLLAGTLAPGTALAETDLIGGATFLTGAPRGAFDGVVGYGYGLEGHALVTPASGPFGLRVQGSFLVYGHERIVVPFSGTRGRVGLDLTTDNWIGSFALGPQLVARSGPVRPYVYGVGGLSYFATTSEVRSEDSILAVARTTNFDDVTFRWSVGGGVNIPVSRTVALDLGVAYVSNDRVSYLAEGDILDDGSGGALFTPRRSEANLVQFTVGFSGGW